MENQKIIHDYTQGNLPKQLLVFSIPFMLSNALQVVYSLVDMMIVGHFVGSDGLSGVSIASQVFMFITMICIGFSNGGQVLIAQYIGAGRKKDLNDTIGNIFTLLFLIGIIMMIIGFMVIHPLLTLLNTPNESYKLALQYFLVSCGGILFTYGYNAVSGVLRGMGDSKHPFIFIMIASVLNIFLDFLFVALLDWKTAGAALATIIGQAVAFITAVIYLYHERVNFNFDFKGKSFLPKKSRIRLLMKLGIPFALQTCSINISMMFVQGLVNQAGVSASAVFGVGIKINDVINKVTMGLSFATSTICAQNFAAGNYKRTSQSVYLAFLYSIGFYIVFTIVYIKYRMTIYGFFTSDQEVLELSKVFVSAIVWGYPAFVIIRGSNGLIRGIGNVKLNLILGLLNAFVFRIGLSYLFGVILDYGLFGYFFGYGLGAYGMAIPGVIYFWSGRWKKFKLLKA